MTETSTESSLLVHPTFHSGQPDDRWTVTYPRGLLVSAASIFVGAPIIICVALIHIDATRWFGRTGPESLRSRYIGPRVHPSCVRMKLLSLTCDEYNRVKLEIRMVVMLLATEVILVIIGADGLLDVLVDSAKSSGS